MTSEWMGTDMGCDIHMISQVKRDGIWITYDANIYDNRNYALFGILAGVRGKEFPTISEPKGLPDDLEADPEDRGYSYYIDGHWLGDHSTSYLSLTELERYDWDQLSYELNGERYTLKDESFYCGVMEYLRELSKKFGGPDNVRIVFGFDS